jgi:hypothetical protein
MIDHQRPPFGGLARRGGQQVAPRSIGAAFPVLFRSRWGIRGVREKAAKSRRSKDRDLRYACF